MKCQPCKIRRKYGVDRFGNPSWCLPGDWMINPNRDLNALDYIQRVKKPKLQEKMEIDRRYKLEKEIERRVREELTNRLKNEKTNYTPCNPLRMQTGRATNNNHS